VSSDDLMTRLASTFETCIVSYRIAPKAVCSVLKYNLNNSHSTFLFFGTRSDYKSLIRIQALKQWQLRLNSEAENKLHSIEPRVNVINIRLPRRVETIIHRLRIGHTYFRQGHLHRGKTPPRCLACQVDLTVEHVLLHCVSIANARNIFFCVTLTSVSELFSKVVSCSIINFIK